MIRIDSIVIVIISITSTIFCVDSITKCDDEQRKYSQFFLKFPISLSLNRQRKSDG